MLTFHSAKGGVGCSVTALATAVAASRRSPTLLVDLDGDLPTLVGHAPTGPGLADWLDADFVTPGSLARLVAPITADLDLLSVGRGRPGGDRSERYELLGRLLRCWPDQVVVDVGVLGATAPLDGRDRIVALATRSVIVSRACYLALSAGKALPPADAAVVILEEERAYSAAECADTLGTPVWVTLPWDHRVARAVDAGTLLARPPASLRPLRQLVGDDA